MVSYPGWKYLGINDTDNICYNSEVIEDLLKASNQSLLLLFHSGIVLRQKMVMRGF